MALLSKRDDEEYDVEGMAQDIVGARTAYRPDEEGFLTKDLYAPQREREAAATPAAELTPQERLGELEAAYRYPTALPEPRTALPIEDRALTKRPPEFAIPDEYLRTFDEAIRGVLAPSKIQKELELQVQGFGLAPGESYRGREKAKVMLAEMEVHRRTAAGNLARTMADFMLEPSKFAKDIWAKQLEAGLGERRLGLEERRFALEEEKLPGLMAQMGRRAAQAPATVTGIGERGEKILYQWNPEEGRFKVLSRGAVPVSVGKEGKLVSPTTGEIVYEGAEGEGRGLKESFAKEVYKAYLNEMKQIAKEYETKQMVLENPEKQKQILFERKERELRAREDMLKEMGGFGFGKLFPEHTKKTAVPTATEEILRTRIPSLEDFIARHAPHYPEATREQFESEYKRRYGVR